MSLEEDTQNLWENVGSSLRTVREQAGLTQRQAAKLAGSSQSRLSEVEIGKADLFVSTIQKWASVYGYTVEIHLVPVDEE
jgi:transcriptional regulator with XRE-family HTH domain